MRLRRRTEALDRVDVGEIKAFEAVLQIDGDSPGTPCRPHAGVRDILDGWVGKRGPRVRWAGGREAACGPWAPVEGDASRWTRTVLERVCVYLYLSVWCRLRAGIITSSFCTSVLSNWCLINIDQSVLRNRHHSRIIPIKQLDVEAASDPPHTRGCDVLRVEPPGRARATICF